MGLRVGSGSRSPEEGWLGWLSLGACIVVSTFACASHSDHTLAARTALDAGNPQKALELYNERLDVETAKELPKNVGGDNTVLLLDRSMILQQLEQYPLSSRDLEIADKQIEVLDFSHKAIDDIGKYLFSDSTGPYKAPFYEKLLINTENMLNYLQVGDLNGARVEARRLAVMQAYISDHEGEGAALTGPGSYLAGFIFEKSGQPEEALRYYDEALQHGEFDSLEPVVSRLAALSSYRTERIKKILEAKGKATPAADGDAAATSELLVVVNHGRVPAKLPKRIPIGLALTYASAFISPSNVEQANRLAAQGLVTWVNYPTLAKDKSVTPPTLAVDGQAYPVELALAVDDEAQKAWEDARGAVVASAITRLIARIVAGEVARQAGGKDSLVGTLLSLGTQVTLTATDIPDTRSWAALPAHIDIARIALPPGAHEVVVGASNSQKRVKVDLKPGGWSVVSVTVLR
jgi:tetratricopeptide (TPR) repeat protein